MEAGFPRLEAWLAEKAGADRVTVVDEGPLSGGAISLNLAVTLEIAGGRLAGRRGAVLRTGSAAVFRQTWARLRTTMLRAAFDAELSVPEPLFVGAADGADDALLGAPLHHAPGAGRCCRAASWSSRMNRSGNWRELGRQLGLIHSIKPGVAELGFLPLPEPSPALQCKRVAGHG